jgi:hypothetical protein
VHGTNKNEGKKLLLYLLTDRKVVVFKFKKQIRL